MANKQPKNKRQAALTADRPLEFLLHDLRLLTVVGKRSLPPEQAKKGVIRLKVEIPEVVTPDTESHRFGTLKYIFSVTGYKGERKEDGTFDDSNAPISFEIQLEAEALYTIHGPLPVAETSLNKAIIPVIKQVHSLLASRARDMASAMGYAKVGIPMSISEGKITAFQQEIDIGGA